MLNIRKLFDKKETFFVDFKNVDGTTTKTIQHFIDRKCRNQVIEALGNIYTVNYPDYYVCYVYETNCKTLTAKNIKGIELVAKEEA